MLLDMRAQAQIHWNKGYPKYKTHDLGTEQRYYCKQLSDTADIENLPAVVQAIYENHLETHEKEPYTFRQYRYILIDEKTFDKVKCK